MAPKAADAVTAATGAAQGAADAVSAATERLREQRTRPARDGSGHTGRSPGCGNRTLPGIFQRVVDHKPAGYGQALFKAPNFVVWIMNH